MKTLLVSAALLGLLAGAAGAQDAAPVPGAPAPVAGKPAAPPPPPGGPTPAGAPMPGPREDRGPLPRLRRRKPLISGSRAAAPCST